MQKHRLVKFITKTTCENETQTQELALDPEVACDKSIETPQPSVLSTDVQADGPQSASEDEGEKHPRVTPHASDSGRYPTRERKPPGYLRDYTVEDTDDDSTLISVDQGSSTFFSSRTPWLRETLSRDPHPRRHKFGPDIHIIYLELSVSHTHTLPYTCLNRITNHL